MNSKAVVRQVLEQSPLVFRTWFEIETGSEPGERLKTLVVETTFDTDPNIDGSLNRIQEIEGLVSDTLTNRTTMVVHRLKIIPKTGGALESELSDGEIALMDAVKSLIEVLLTAGIATPAVFDKLLRNQSEAYAAKQMPSAVAIMEMLRRFVTNEQREAHREQVRQILRESPKGQA